MNEYNDIFEIYSKEDCVYCAAAKKLMDDMDIEYIEYNLSDSEDGEYFISVLTELNLRSVPQIFLGDEYIGGFKELREHLDEEF